MPKPKLRKAGRELVEKYGSLSAAPDEALAAVTKRCSGPCRKRKPLSEFHRYSGRSVDGFRAVCKQCRREAERERQRVKRKPVQEETE